MDLDAARRPRRPDGLLLRDDGAPLRRHREPGRLLRRDAEVRPDRPRQRAGRRRRAGRRNAGVASGASRVAFGASHDEQERKALEDLERVIASGTGRYENFALLGRLPRRGRATRWSSPSTAAPRARRTSSTSAARTTRSRACAPSRPRAATSAVGWRHRWQGLEAAAAFRWTKPDGYNATAGSFQNASGNLFGADAEVRWRCRAVDAAARTGSGCGGNLDVHRESLPDFATATRRCRRRFRRCAWASGTPGRGRTCSSRRRTTASTCPFVVARRARDRDGRRSTGASIPTPSTRSSTSTSRSATPFSPAIRLRVGVVLAWGAETVTLHDSAGVLPTLDARRAAPRHLRRRPLDRLGSPETALFIGADFAIGSPA